jgi:hypothetical protein
VIETALPKIARFAVETDSWHGTREKDMVLQTYAAIATDKRHTGVMVLLEHAMATRQFASWSMGFSHRSKADLQKLPGAALLFKTRQDEIALRGRAGDALILLKSFSDGSVTLR